MAKLKATPKNFAEALAVLNGRQSMRLGNNTYLEACTEVKNDSKVLQIDVRLHNTDIVSFLPDGRVLLFTGGYRTVTTKERINHFITGRLYQKARRWYVASQQLDGSINWDAPREFVEGFNLYAFETQEVL